MSDAKLNQVDVQGVKPAVVFGVAAIAFATLCFEIALVRVLSVALWYHFAFLVVSTAVLGAGLAGMTLAMRPQWLEGAWRRRAASMAFASALAMVGSAMVVSLLPFDPFRLLLEPMQIGVAALYVLAVGLPFYLSGLSIGLALSMQREQIGLVYGGDLAGAGIGCSVVIFLFEPLGGTGAMVFPAAACAAGAYLLASCDPSRRRNLVFGTGALAFVMLAFFASSWLPVKLTRDKIVQSGLTVDAYLEQASDGAQSRWNALSRVDVLSDGQVRRILIDGGAAVVDVPTIKAPIPAYRQSHDIPTFPMPLLKSKSDVLVLGSGAGREVLYALAWGAGRVDAVEINPAIAQLAQNGLGSEITKLFANPRVNLFIDEGRSFLRRTQKAWDLIISVHTISNAATSSGATSLAESYMLTEEAFDDYLSHLSEEGLLFITRPEKQLRRLTATAARSLYRIQKTPSKHLIIWRVPRAAPDETSFVSGILLSQKPYSADQIKAIEQSAARTGLELLFLPNSLARQGGEFNEVFQKTSSTAPPKLIPRWWPVVDDRPFFNQHTPWYALSAQDFRRVLTQGESGRRALEDEPVAEVSLVVLLVLTLVFAGAFTFLPLIPLRQQLIRKPRVFIWILAYFGLLGVGFMFAELGLVHRLTLFVGDPTIAFALVIGGLLLGSGAGAYVSDRLGARGHDRFFPLLTALTLASVAYLLIPSVVAHALGAHIAVRIALVALVCLPVGFCLGVPFPAGMRRLAKSQRVRLAFAWGINGFASVLGSVTCLLLATTFGFSWVLFCSCMIYVVAGLLLWWGDRYAL